MTTSKPPRKSTTSTWKKHLNNFYIRVKTLQGDPHYVAMGMAIGVFVAVTPTVPLHTVLALVLAFVLKGSKPAAVIGAQFCNPLTIGPFYIGSYQLGMLLLGRDINIDLQNISFKELLAQGSDVAIAMVVGGALLGIVPAIGAYFFTFHMFRKIRERHERAHATEKGGNPDTSGSDDAVPDADTENAQEP